MERQTTRGGGKEGLSSNRNRLTVHSVMQTRSKVCGPDDPFLFLTSIGLNDFSFSYNILVVVVFIYLEGI